MDYTQIKPFVLAEYPDGFTTSKWSAENGEDWFEFNDGYRNQANRLVHLLNGLIAALEVSQDRAAKLEAAARIDIDAANAECAARDCKAWISRGGPCDQCPCVTVSSTSDALGVALCSVQKVTDYAGAQP